MVDILHRVGIESSVEDVYAALTTLDGLAGWWTEDTRGDTAVGGVIRFRFDVGGFDMLVLESQPGARVAWRVVDGPPEWIDTTVSWDLSQEDEYAIVLFAHAGWRDPVAFMSHCSTKWATFLMSLKSLAETGKGAPAPHDVKISNWH